MRGNPTHFAPLRKGLHHLAPGLIYRSLVVWATNPPMRFPIPPPTRAGEHRVPYTRRGDAGQGGRPTGVEDVGHFACGCPPCALIFPPRHVPPDRPTRGPQRGPDRRVRPTLRR